MTPSSEPSLSISPGPAATAEPVPASASASASVSAAPVVSTHSALDAEVRATAMLLIGALAVIGGITALVSGLLTLMGTT